MRLTPPPVVLAGVLLAAVRGPLAAQIDYRNLDDDRPVLTEDAYPVERHAFEFLLPYAFEDERGAGRVHAFIPEVEYGIIRNGQLGLKAPIAGARETGDTEWGLAGLRVFGLYNLNSEGRTLPALSARADLFLPVGSLGGDATRVSLKAIATRSWGRTRVHANAAWTLGDETSLAAVEAGHRWSYSLAADRTLFRQSVLLIGEVAARRAAKGAPVEVNAALGARYQWTPTTVLDLGVRRRLRDVAGPDLAVSVGLSHAFALRWLMPPGR
jgi:hypothetical protein